MSVAVIRLGGKQFTVEPGKIIDVPRLKEVAGTKLSLASLIDGKKVEASVVDQRAGQKIRVVKFKDKIRYTRTIGSKPLLTRVKIESIN